MLNWVQYLHQLRPRLFLLSCQFSSYFVENIFNIILSAMQPGYGASLVDFHITKSEFVKDKIVRIARIDLLNWGYIVLYIIRMHCSLSIFYNFLLSELTYTFKLGFWES